jgi:quercetin dioxygenase-like cupin family protein
MRQMFSEPFAVAPDAGLRVENPAGGVTTFKAMADATGGALTALEVVVAPGQGPPLHVHRGQDELMYTLEGRFRFKLGDELREAPPNTFIFIPARHATHVAERRRHAGTDGRGTRAGGNRVRALLRSLRRPTP